MLQKSKLKSRLKAESNPGISSNICNCYILASTFFTKKLLVISLGANFKLGNCSHCTGMSSFLCSPFQWTRTHSSSVGTWVLCDTIYMILWCTPSSLGRKTATIFYRHQALFFSAASHRPFLFSHALHFFIFPVLYVLINNTLYQA